MQTLHHCASAILGPISNTPILLSDLLEILLVKNKSKVYEQLGLKWKEAENSGHL